MAADPSRPHYPASALIESYGDGGFRFAGMSHRGSILCLPGSIWAWTVRAPEEIDEAALAPVFAAAARIDLLLIGTGAEPWTMPAALRWRIRDYRMGLDIMPTAAAVRTYNVLLGENRRVAAALVAVP